MRVHMRLKAIIFAAALTASALLAPLYAFATVDSASGALSSTLAPKNVMVNVKDADVRDVLSAVAMNMGYNIVYTGPASTISINLDNLSPAAAFDYILKTLDLTYLQEGSTYIVGDRATLQDNFSRSLTLTRFNLRYITPDVMGDMISRLRLPVTVITLNTNANALWVQGFPADIAKVRELVTVLDIVDNSEVPTPLEGADGKALTPIKLSYLTAYEFRLLLQALGIDYSVSLLDDGNRIYLYATPDELDTVLGIKDIVDQKNTFFDDSSANGFAVLTAYDMVSKQTAITAIGAMCPNLSIISADNRSTAFVVMGEPLEIDRAKDLLRKLDTNTEKLYTTAHIYPLKNITAAEADRRLQGVTFGDNVVWYITTHPDFSGTIFVYCSDDYWASHVEELLEEIDKDTGKMFTAGMPIYAITNAAEDRDLMQSYAEGKKLYLETMLAGIINPGDIQVLEYKNMWVLYLQKSDGFTIETFALIEAMVNRLSEVSVDENSDTDQLTFEYWWKNVKGEQGDVPNPISNADLQAYGNWLVNKLSGISGTVVNPFSFDNTFTFDEPYSYEPPITTVPTTQQPETPTPTSADEESFNSARTALDRLFYDGGIASEINAETTADAVLGAAASATYGIQDAVLRFNPASPSSYVKPTETEKGSLTVSIILEVGGYWEIYDVELVLPASKAADGE